MLLAAILLYQVAVITYFYFPVSLYVTYANLHLSLCSLEHIYTLIYMYIHMHTYNIISTCIYTTVVLYYFMYIYIYTLTISIHINVVGRVRLQRPPGVQREHTRMLQAAYGLRPQQPHELV